MALCLLLPVSILQWAQQAACCRASVPAGITGLVCAQQQMVVLRAKLHSPALNILKRFL